MFIDIFAMYHGCFNKACKDIFDQLKKCENLEEMYVSLYGLKLFSEKGLCAISKHIDNCEELKAWLKSEKEKEES